MKIFITGATGFVGRMLVARLIQDENELVCWSRNPKQAKAVLGSSVTVVSSKDVDHLSDHLKGCHAVINLQGESLFGRRWTPEQKVRLHESRIGFARLLADSVRKLGHKAPRIIISASAVGYYGAEVSKPVDEEAPAGSDFLARLCRDWEDTLLALRTQGIRVVALRIGMVLGKNGGAMQKLLPPFKLGLGGRLGSGNQYMAWIHMSDLVSMIRAALHNERYNGPINATAPGTITNRQFTEALSAQLNRPAVFHMPAIVLKLALGKVSSVLLGGQRVQSSRASSLGFKFEFPEINSALVDVLSDFGVSITRSDGGDFVLKQKISVRKPIEEVFDFFSHPENLGAITPSHLGFSIRGNIPLEIKKGLIIDYDIKLGVIPLRWTSSIDAWEQGSSFVDTQVRGPYSKWSHKHDFESKGDSTIITDTVSYRLPFGPLGRLAHYIFIRATLTDIFAYRSYFATLRFGDLQQKPSLETSN
jgi:uncharacterized protein (TIGR01777 family)